MQAVFEVHNTLGPGFIESIYEEALVFELEIRQIAFERQKTSKCGIRGELSEHSALILSLTVGSFLN